MGKKSKSSSQSTSTATRTPINPEWVTSGLEGLGGKIMGLANENPRQFVAGASPLQTRAFVDAAKMKTSPRFNQAGDIFTQVAGAGANTYDPSQGKAEDWSAQGYDAATYNASSLLEGLDKYMSPYTGQVVDTALADYDFGAGQTRAGQALDEARSGAFGGSGAAITRALTEDSLTRGRGTLSAGLRDTAFTRGAGLSATDAGFRNQAAAANAAAANQAAAFRAQAENQAAAANAAARNQFGLANMDALNEAGRFNAGAMETALARQLSAGGALGSLGAQEGADTRANVALQGQMGAEQRAISQALAGAPISVLQALAGTYSGLPLNLLSGETMTGSQTGSSTSKSWDPMGVFSNALNAGGSAAQGASAIMTALSDRRLKTDVERIGERPDGLGVYAFRYLWSPVRHIGVMAQEVLDVKPEAVVHLPGGYMAVNYGAL
jgi:hypothetical protein